MMGIDDVEGAIIDPLTNDIMFSTSSLNNRIMIVQGSSVPP